MTLRKAGLAGIDVARAARSVFALVWTAAFASSLLLPATEVPEATPFTAFFAATQLFHATEKAALSASLVAAFTAGLILAATLSFGRFYCSTICPLGACQDGARRVFSSAAGIRRTLWDSGKLAFPGSGSFKGSWTWLRACAVALAFAGFAFGAPAFAAFLDPYSIFARGLSRVGDGVAWGLNAFASAGLPIPVFTIHVDPALAALSLVPFMAVLAASAVRSRSFCGTLCPAGSALGLVNTVAAFRVRMDPGKCSACGACERVCRTGSADSSRRRIDATRCVQCLDCIRVCPTGAIRYGLPFRPPPKSKVRKAPDQREKIIAAMSRAEFLKAGGVLMLAAAAVPVARSLDPFAPRPSGIPGGSALAAPPGALSVERFAGRCTACGACVRACPSGVLRPSLLGYGLTRTGVPHMDYDHAYCQYECVACGMVCPSGAILRLDLAVKKITAIGKTVLELPRCIVVEKRTRCGACAEHCPTGAISMAISGDPGLPRLPVPVFSRETCIGCGACRTVCPATPVKALAAHGLAVHETASPPPRPAPSPGGEPPNGGFPF